MTVAQTAAAVMVNRNPEPEANIL